MTSLSLSNLRASNPQIFVSIFFTTRALKSLLRNYLVTYNNKIFIFLSFDESSGSDSNDDVLISSAVVVEDENRRRVRLASVSRRVFIHEQILSRNEKRVERLPNRCCSH